MENSTRRTEQIGVAVTKEEKTAWEECAKARGMPLAAFVRQCVNIYISALKKSKRG